MSATMVTEGIQQNRDARVALDSRRLIEELQLRNERKDRFITILAHELRSPLAPIANAVDVLTVASGDSQLVPHACRIIRRQMSLLSRLVDDLFDIACIERGGMQLDRVPVDLRVVIDTATDAVRPLIELRRQHFTSTLPAESVVLTADAARLTQVFINLLHNAVKYTDSGGYIELIAERTGVLATVRVRDSGIGIAADALAGIFEMFTRAVPQSARDAGGLGIGLALARELIELHGGSISAYSEGVGRGSEFVVRLPTDERQAYEEPCKNSCAVAQGAQEPP
jgi:signal transduction histidine kinase